MRICRYNANKLGLVKGDQLIDVTLALNQIPQVGSQKMSGDSIISNLETIKPAIEANRKMGYVQSVKNVSLKSPVANPSKIITALANYKGYTSEVGQDAAINVGREVNIVENYGLCRKPNSLVTGVGEDTVLGHTEHRDDHEIKLAIIIGRTAKNVQEPHALDYVAGYSIGLDITLRSAKEGSTRKSPASYAVLGPWITTADEIKDPDNLGFSLRINGQIRQDTNTKFLVLGCRELIAYASKAYTLHPGDILMTGTPSSCGPLEGGDLLVCRFDIIGQMEFNIR